MSCKEEFIEIFKANITREGADKLLEMTCRPALPEAFHRITIGWRDNRMRYKKIVVLLQRDPLHLPEAPAGRPLFRILPVVIKPGITVCGLRPQEGLETPSAGLRGPGWRCWPWSAGWSRAGCGQSGASRWSGRG